MQHVPLHLCSIQILLIFYTRFSTNERLRERILAFMYPTCLIGAVLAMLIPTVFIENVDVSLAFVHPQVYQYLLYHAMLVVLGLYIPVSGQVKLTRSHYFSTMGILGGMAFVSLYVNSILASPTYENGVLKYVDYVPNLFFTYYLPIELPMTQL